MQIYFGNIKIVVTNNVLGSVSSFNHSNFIQFLNQNEISELSLNITEYGDLKNFCDSLVKFWPQAKKIEKKLSLYVYSFSVLVDCFSKYLQIVHACGGVVIDSHAHILLIKRNKIWDLPKGKLEDDESFEECSIREIEEETGIKSSVLDFITNTYHTYDTYGELCLKITHWYKMKYLDGNLIPQKEEDIEKAKWVNALELSDYKSKMFPSLLSVIEKV